MKKDFWFHVAAVSGGALMWILVSFASGRKEAWDSSLYFVAGMQAVCVLSLVLGYLAPKRPWRWGVEPCMGQFASMLLSQGPGSLLPLGVILFGVFSIPSVLAAQLGAIFGRKRATGDKGK
jgi:hypothetical protein